MVDFSDRTDAREWFRNQSREVVIAITVRCALRLLPTIVTRDSDFDALAVFRATAVPWAMLTDLTDDFGPKLHLAAYSATNAAENAAAYAARQRSAGVSAALATAANAALAAGAQSGANIANAAADVVTYVYDADTAGAAAADAAFIQGRRGGATAATELAATPLWPNGVPEWATSMWAQARSTLVKAKQDWEVWIDWYEDRLAGRQSDARIDLAKALLPDDLWNPRRPKAVNTEIKRLIDEIRKQGPLPDENSMPKQAPSAAIFQRHESGAIAIVPPGPQDRLADTDEVRDFYSEVVDKNTELLSLGANMLGQRLYEKARIFRSRLPEHSSQAVERLVWSSGNTLRSILAAHDLVAADRDPHPEKLDRGAAERLRDVVGTFNQLAVADPSMRRRDANRAGPQEHQCSLDEISIVAGIAIEAAGNRFITTVEAGEELSQQIVGTGEVGTDLPGRLGVQLARDTSRNFFAATMVAAYRAIRSVPAMARGEGGFASKEYFSGVYKTAGAATYAAVVGAATSAYFLREEIVQFLVSNSDVLRVYAGLAFEHSPGFMQMLEWLDRNIAAEAGTPPAAKPK